jgi:hypothetical protein
MEGRRSGWAVRSTGQEIMLDDAVAVSCIGELEPQNLRVFLCLLKPVTCGPISCPAIARVNVNSLCQEINSMSDDACR